MRAFLHELFHVSEQEKIREKTLLARITVSFVIMVFCLTANVVSAYAYFTCTITSGNNTIRSASFFIDVQPPENAVSVLPDTDSYLLDNQSNETAEYTFVIKKATQATASVGYCRVEVVTDVNTAEDEDPSNDVQKFFTRPIGTYLDPDTEEKMETLSREIVIKVLAGQTAQVSFHAEWGSCSQEPIIEKIITPNFTGEILTVDEEEDDPEAETDAESEAASEEETTGSQQESTGTDDAESGSDDTETGTGDTNTDSDSADEGSGDGDADFGDADTGSDDAGAGDAGADSDGVDAGNGDDDAGSDGAGGGSDNTDTGSQGEGADPAGQDLTGSTGE